MLWRLLRARRLGAKFRRQHPIPPYIADFACIDLRLVVEVDGGQHAAGRDAQRDAEMHAQGWAVLRYWNNDVLANPDGVLADILRAVEGRGGA